MMVHGVDIEKLTPEQQMQFWSELGKAANEAMATITQAAADFIMAVDKATKELHLMTESLKPEEEPKKIEINYLSPGPEGLVGDFSHLSLRERL